jgi:hypothetical protein
MIASAPNAHGTACSQNSKQQNDQRLKLLAAKQELIKSVLTAAKADLKKKVKSAGYADMIVTLLCQVRSKCRPCQPQSVWHFSKRVQ